VFTTLDTSHFVARPKTCRLQHDDENVLKDTGVELVEDICSQEGVVSGWQEWEDRIPQRAKRAFEKLLSELDFSRFPNGNSAEA
jgi:hypothetical protein